MTMLRSRTFALILGALLFAVWGTPSAAQDAPGLTLIRDSATRDLVRSLLGRASALGLPTAPLMSKALEGVAKKASTKSIESAINALEKRMRRASALLAPDPTVDELAQGADALYVGVPDQTLRQMRALAPKRSIATELGFVTELVARKVPPKKASAWVLDLMARNVTGAQLTALNSAVQEDVAAGIAPAVALNLRGRGIMSLLPPPPSAATLQGRPR